ncbi:Uncharacterised protein [Helicobacter fennelliae]|uniref:Outer membrane protein n=2 Tax=Helicobacter TaxID=209 RepID=A0A2X3BDD9_9HELI|nr:hypothetical protein [Helicobacter fennelliae]SQB98633.1 Uncharacterised protein [Helicobacter fennelliae]STQ84117.1 Uncharacterised protein [Helicobacter fennelliae]
MYFMQAGVGLDYMLSFSSKPNAWGLFLNGGYEYGFGKFTDHLNDKKDVGSKVSMYIPFIDFGLTKAFGSGHFSMDLGCKVQFGKYFSHNQSGLSGDIAENQYSGVRSNDIALKLESSSITQVYLQANSKF